ncbi:MAG TPA: acyltransferase [Pseudonocardiaceae bacterium]|jgi:peptidoglycan/LPS O-acetylase OafA/YrhL|nr:acyltransferase [Pseudonocardiaceae bacterium]
MRRAAAGAGPAVRPGSASRAGAFRTDIQGLRALAIAMVVCFHLWPTRLSGGFVGVDVFFVVSGFLITSHLLRSQPTTSRDLASFWVRRIRRLLPAALTVIVTVLLATWAFAPVPQWRKTGIQAVSSAVYLQNWQLAPGSSIHGDPHPTALQHYWSLSVEEQFYLVWPILILLCVRYGRRRGVSPLPAVRLAIGTLAIASIAFSVWFTRNHPAPAYFVTPTRMWELAAGGLTAALVPALLERIPERSLAFLRIAAVWVGFAAIAFAARNYHAGHTPVPESTVPVIGAALIIAADRPVGFTPNALLRARPVQYLGDISYSMYLWHWPLIVLVPMATGQQLGNWSSLGVVAGALVLAGLTKRQIEDRFRHSRQRRSLIIPCRWAVAGMAGVALLGGLEIVGAAAVGNTANAQVAHVRVVSQR